MKDKIFEIRKELWMLKWLTFKILALSHIISLRNLLRIQNTLPPGKKLLMKRRHAEKIEAWQKHLSILIQRSWSIRLLSGLTSQTSTHKASFSKRERKTIWMISRSLRRILKRMLTGREGSRGVRIALQDSLSKNKMWLLWIRGFLRKDGLRKW